MERAHHQRRRGRPGYLAAMAKVLQAIIMAGFDYQGGGVKFGEIAQHRRDLLIAANAQLTVTIMDVGAGTTTVSAGKLIVSVARFVPVKA